MGMKGEPMSLMFKGINLPKHCEAVEVKFYISDIDVYRYTYVEGHREVSAVFTGEALDNIVQIPKDHGRLIDADELVKHLRKDPLFDLVERYGISGVIESRPTILDKERE